jgi:hypothetical protein
LTATAAPSPTSANAISRPAPFAPRLPPLTFVAKIAVLLPQGFRLGIGRRNLPIGGARRASEDKVARRQRQQTADNASLIPAKIIQRTEHFQTRIAGFDPSGR